MPIYEYRCGDCGQKKDYLQKVSDAPIDTCPACGSKSYAKALTAAGFQLKGSGWYATDFKGDGQVAKPADTSSESAKTDSPKTADSSTSTTNTASASAAACNPGCACH
ncbi:MAG: FmdB family transcriptional regulator [Rhodocyclales bacterium]|nr:FmdB family transcriptional regulator [Rhodocyclales bacterium]